MVVEKQKRGDFENFGNPRRVPGSRGVGASAPESDGVEHGAVGHVAAAGMLPGGRRRSAPDGAAAHRGIIGE